MPDCVRRFVCMLPRRADSSFRAFSSSSEKAFDKSHSFDGSSRVALVQRDGFTLVEMVVTLSLLTILMAMSIGALSYYLAGKSLDTAVTELTTQIREAQSLAVTTGNTYRIDFNDSARTTYTLQRRSDSGWVNVRSAISLPSGVSFSTSLQIGDDKYMEFYARGTSESSQIVISGRYDGSRTLTVDGETVNVR